MELVIDANILMSAIIATQGKTFDLIFNEQIRLFSVDKLRTELEKHKLEILEKSGLHEPEFDMFISLICSKINFVPYGEIEMFTKQAEQISPDPNDTEYFALALKLGCAIWSNDKKLKQQDKIRIHSTDELLN